MIQSHGAGGDIREQLRAAVRHLDHLLPGQAPLKDFVHHNTLHGYQHLPFPEALAEARRRTGARGYLPLDRFRALYAEGRITGADLEAALDERPELEPDALLLNGPAGPIPRRALYRIALLHPLTPINPCQLNWRIESLGALDRCQADLSAEERARLLQAAGMPEERAIPDLWNACLEVLGLEHFLAHPEELQELTPDQAERLLAMASSDDPAGPRQARLEARLRQEALEDLDRLLARVGRDLTLRGLLLALTGEDLLERLRPYLIRQLANFLDQGLAPWHHRDRALGFYTAWRRSTRNSPTWMLEGLADWVDHLRYLADDPLEAVIEELERRRLPRERWVGYLECLALELPGWSGMVRWRASRPGYQDQTQPVSTLDYLAVRLVMERMFAHRLCAGAWRVEPSLDLLRWYFRHHPAEFRVRHALYQERLPEYLATRAQRLVLLGGDGTPAEIPHWQRLAQLIWTWQQSPAADRGPGHSLFRHAWPLFRLAQHLGLPGSVLRALSPDQARHLFACLARLDEDTASYLWLCAYERHYRERICNALVNNQGRAPWARRDTRPAAQVVCCMDEREEGLRRHLEEINPAVETLGAAGFFGLPMLWRGLDDAQPVALCPVAVRPAHEIRERPRPGQEALAERRARRQSWQAGWRHWLHQTARRNPLVGSLALPLLAPAALGGLGARLLAPRASGHRLEWLRAVPIPKVPTDLTLTTPDPDPPATPEQPRLGLTDPEQADWVYHFLVSIGLTRGFAPLVLLLGHGSLSENNPHRAAYDCGACSGRHGGPNARVFAQLANRPEVRARLAERGLVIPADCHFLGAFHNTCDENLDWYDLDRVPADLGPALARLQADLAAACQGSAHERSRKFFSAPRNPNPVQALAHIQGRRHDPTQPRPELGHATNACAVVGRRALTRGVFFDRRLFLISYDPSDDPDGQVLETLLLAVGPVGAGINLEYYFSTVDNEQYGSGSKVTHNLVGLLGVMDGAGSDLRTGLPKQMIEIHEAMRLLLIVEAKTEVLTAIHDRQPALRELIGNGWLRLMAEDPDGPALHLFQPDRGWEPWRGPVTPLPQVARSADYYPGTLAPLPPVLIAEGTSPWWIAC